MGKRPPWFQASEPEAVDKEAVKGSEAATGAEGAVAAKGDHVAEVKEVAPESVGSPSEGVAAWMQPGMEVLTVATKHKTKYDK